jgi:peptide deformylase
MILQILKHPDKRLYTIAKPVEDYEFDSDMALYLTVQNMFETMKTNRGIGLAGTQVDIHKQIIVMNVSEPICLINPTVTSTEGTIKFIEGCLSFPKIHIERLRANTVNVSYRDVCGNNIQRTFSGIEAVCIQHECEHLRGETFDQKPKKLTKAA